MSTPTQINPIDYSEFIAALQHVNVQPLWDRFTTLITREPTAPDVPFIWTWESLVPMIERAVAEVHLDDIERRVLLLANPSFGGKVKTTTNLNAALQILGPHERAHPHRHRLTAIRMVLEGNSATTIVDGKPCPMKRGDLILTPAMSWHSHVNEGDDRMVWFDGLDLPLALFDLGVVCFEPGPAREPEADLARHADAVFVQGGIRPTGVVPQSGASPLLRYSGEAVRAAFDGMTAAADGSKTLRYTNPANGGAVMPTIDCYAMDLAADATTRARRSTHNAIVAVVDGEGESTIGAETIRWRRNDIFTIPHWNWARHRASAGGAHLFLMTDREVLSRLGYLVEEERD
jgi:gentisate 1,2-dioxygenase